MRALGFAAFVVMFAARVAIAEPVADRVEVGAFAGYLLVDDEHNLGNASEPAGALKAGAIIGGRGGYALTRSLGLEAEAAYSSPGFVGLPGQAHVIAVRAHAIGHLREGGWRPFVLGGLGAQAIRADNEVSSDVDAEMYWGLGGVAQLPPQLGHVSLRIDLRHRVIEGRIARFSHTFEATLGFTWTLH